MVSDTGGRNAPPYESINLSRRTSARADPLRGFMPQGAVCLCKTPLLLTLGSLFDMRHAALSNSNPACYHDLHTGCALAFTRWGGVGGLYHIASELTAVTPVCIRMNFGWLISPLLLISNVTAPISLTSTGAALYPYLVLRCHDGAMIACIMRKFSRSRTVKTL